MNIMRTSLLVIIFISLVAFGGSGCRHQASQDETPDTSSYHPESTPKTEFEQKLKFIREGHFKHVWVFTRLDGKAFTKEDTDILHTNAPKVVDWVGVEEGKRFIAGSNFDLEPAQMATLKKRYKIEDYTGK
jgi:hypothetical protein